MHSVIWLLRAYAVLESDESSSCNRHFHFFTCSIYVTRFISRCVDGHSKGMSMETEIFVELWPLLMLYQAMEQASQNLHKLKPTRRSHKPDVVGDAPKFANMEISTIVGTTFPSSYTSHFICDHSWQFLCPSEVDYGDVGRFYPHSGCDSRTRLLLRLWNGQLKANCIWAMSVLLTVDGAYEWDVY